MKDLTKALAVEEAVWDIVRTEVLFYAKGASQAYKELQKVGTRVGDNYAYPKGEWENWRQKCALDRRQTAAALAVMKNIKVALGIKEPLDDAG